jgi:membrane-anchored protein YejM (alkaline phosphatase superfamily)
VDPQQLFDIVFIAVIAIVFARWLQRRQRAEERRRERELAARDAVTPSGEIDGDPPPGDRDT